MDKINYWLIFAFVVAGVGAADKPSIQIESDKAEHLQDKQQTIFLDNVMVYYDTYELAGNKLVISKKNNKNNFVLNGSPINISCKNCDLTISGYLGKEVQYQEEKELVQIQGGINLCAKNDCESYNIRSDSALLERHRQFLTFHGKPQVTGVWTVEDTMEKIYVNANRVEIDIKQNLVRLTGLAKVSRGEVKISGESIDINTKTGEFSASQRVKAVY